ncbi:MAG: SIS domain-containing protein [Aliidongia sp.]
MGELRNPLSLAERLTRTLSETGGSVASAMDMTLEIHQRSLDNLRKSITAEQFEAAVEILVAAQRMVVFGLGPSSAIANYLVMQLGRFGFNAFSLTNTGLLFADDLGKLRAGDTVIMFAYGRVYAELAALVDMVERRGASIGSYHGYAGSIPAGQGRLGPVRQSRAIRHVQHAHRHARLHRGAPGRDSDQASGRDGGEPPGAQRCARETRREADQIVDRRAEGVSGRQHAGRRFAVLTNSADSAPSR